MLGINLTLNSIALASRTLTQKALAVLRSFGSDAHVYMPGVGWMNGLTAGNWIDSAGTTPSVVDNPVGKVDDANGSIDATQSTTANKPILKIDGSGKYYWQFDGGNDSLSLGSVPWGGADDHAVVLCAARTSTIGERYPFMVAGVGSVALSPAIVFSSDSIVKAYWRGDNNVLQIANTAIPYTASVPLVISASKVGNTKKARVNSGSFATNLTSTGASTLTGAAIGSRIDATTPFDGAIYPIIAIKGTVSDAQLLTLEKWVANASGVTI